MVEVFYYIFYLPHALSWNAVVLVFCYLFFNILKRVYKNENLKIRSPFIWGTWAFNIFFVFISWFITFRLGFILPFFGELYSEYVEDHTKMVIQGFGFIVLWCVIYGLSLIIASLTFKEITANARMRKKIRVYYSIFSPVLLLIILTMYFSIFYV